MIPVAGLHILSAEQGAPLDDARRLIAAYFASRPGDPALATSKAELDTLPGAYAAPQGGLLVAYQQGTAVGCVAIRREEGSICEMKRLYVHPPFRGQGIGRALAEATLGRARRLGYTHMRLDSIPSMQAAQQLYPKLGFYEIPPYRHNPNEGTRYFEAVL